MILGEWRISEFSSLALDVFDDIGNLHLYASNWYIDSDSFFK